MRVKPGDRVTIQVGNRRYCKKKLIEALQDGRTLKVIETYVDTRKVVTRDASRSVVPMAKVELWDGSTEYVSANVLVPAGP